MRCLSKNQKRLCIYVCPFLITLLIYVTLCSMAIFRATEVPSNLYSAGLALQIFFLFMGCRELLISCHEFWKGRITEYTKRYMRYALICCFDNFLLLSLAVWASVALGRDNEACQSLALCAPFYRATLANVVIAFLLFCGNCCCPGPCILAYLIQKSDRFMRDALIEEYGQPVADETEEHSRRRAANLRRQATMDGLKKGEFA